MNKWQVDGPALLLDNSTLSEMRAAILTYLTWELFIERFSTSRYPTWVQTIDEISWDSQLLSHQ
jgi:hypothetical protein